MVLRGYNGISGKNKEFFVPKKKLETQLECVKNAKIGSFINSN